MSTASNDGFLKVWVIPRNGLTNDLVSGEEHASLYHGSKVLLAKWNPYANFTIASAGSDCLVKVWDI